MSKISGMVELNSVFFSFPLSADCGSTLLLPLISCGYISYHARKYGDWTAYVQLWRHSIYIMSRPDDVTLKTNWWKRLHYITYGDLFERDAVMNKCLHKLNIWALVSLRQQVGSKRVNIQLHTALSFGSYFPFSTKRSEAWCHHCFGVWVNMSDIWVSSG